MNGDANVDIKLIDNEKKLEELIDAFETTNTVGVDLEADSMYHFKEKVCLLQIALNGTSVVIDPLQIHDMSSLKPLFSRSDIKKIFHGADYDVRSLNRDFDIEINNLFDTQLACRFLGYKETGLEAVMHKLFNVDLDKRYQKKNWAKRPLPHEMIDYAAKDVIYLAALARFLESELLKKGRLSWVLEECEYLSKVKPNIQNGEPLFVKFKGSGRLKPKNLAILEALLRHRRDIAERKDKPVFKIIGNDSILKMARHIPLTLRNLEKIEALSRRQLQMYGTELVEVICTANAVPPEDYPVYPRKRRAPQPPNSPRRMKALKNWRKRIAEKLKMDPGLICNKSLLNAISVLNPKDPSELEKLEEMRGWQREAFGKEIVKVLKDRK